MPVIFAAKNGHERGRFGVRRIKGEPAQAVIRPDRNIAVAGQDVPADGPQHVA